MVKSDELLEKAEQGDSDALFELGKVFHLGTDTEAKDHIQAKYWYEKALNQNPQHSKALHNLALLYITSEDIPQNPDLALELFEQSASLGNVQAMYSIGLTYLRDEVVPRDIELAKEWLKKASDLNHLDACHWLGFIYSEFLDDKVKALSLFKHAAENGFLLSHLQLANFYENGIACEVNTDLAIHHYTLAAEGDDVDAMNKLVGIYLKKNQIEKARYWAHRAAEKGDFMSAYIASKLDSPMFNS